MRILAILISLCLGILFFSLMLILMIYSKGGTRFVNRLVAQVSDKHKLKGKDMVYLVGAGCGMAAALLLNSGHVRLTQLFLGLLSGMVFARFYLYVRHYAVKAGKIRETAVLYLMVDMYLRSGYTMVQSLRGARAMTPRLARYLDRCLEMWPAGPVPALEQLRVAIGLSEADTLVSVLIHAHDIGAASLAGAMEEGSKQLQQLQRALVKTQAAGRPVAFSFFRMLPLLGCLGIVVGPLVVQLTQALSRLFDLV